MKTTSSLLKKHRGEILAAAARHNATTIRVFGSQAEGKATRSSDVDFLVEMNDDATLFDRAALMLDLQRILGCDVDVVTEKALKPRLREAIVKQAVRV